MKRSLLVGSLVALTVALACGGPPAETDTDSDGSGGEGGADGSATGGNAGNDESGGSGGSETDGDTGGNGSGAGENSGGGGMGGNSSAASTFCQDYLTAICDWADECGSWPSCEDWPAYSNSERECNDAVTSLEADFLTFDAELAASCLAAMDSVACNNGPPFFEANVRLVCPEVFVGTVETGDECTSADSFSLFDECDDGYCLRPPGEVGGLECVGTCTGYKEEGETCAETDRCALGLYCIDSECVPPVGLGEECGELPCEPGLSCAGVSTYTCRAPGGPGSSCADEYDCAWPGVCTDDECVVDVGEGGVCRDTDTCEDGLYCQGSSTSSDALCAIPVASGDECDPNYDQCEEGYGCSLYEPYVCVEELGAEDEVCGPSGCDTGLWCDTSDEPTVCRSRGGEGADCPSSEACQEGLFCMSDGECHGLGDLDEPCSPSYSAYSCAEGLFCDRETGLCKAPRAEGETCNPLLALESCLDGFYCACLADGCPYYTTEHDPADVCAARKDNGEECSTDTECSSAYCIGEECTDTPPIIENCSR